MTAESVLVANRQPYVPRGLPAAFSQVAGAGAAPRGTGIAPPEPAIERPGTPSPIETRLPPEVPAEPYRIGVGDVILLATPQTGSSVEELTGLLAAQTRRQGYTVQDDGAIAIPDVGRMQLAGLTLEEAEAEVFRLLVQNRISPSFSVEIAEFNSRRVSVGGAVARSAVLPIRLTPLTLDEAIAAAGGTSVRDADLASIRIHRDGTFYQLPLRMFLTSPEARALRLRDGDAVYVDSEFDLDQAEAYFRQQIELSNFRQQARAQALEELRTEMDLRRGVLKETRENFEKRLELGAEARDYAYVTGEVEKQGRVPLSFEQRATLADALYTEGGGFPNMTGNPRHIYVLRGSPEPDEFDSVTAWNLDARNAANFVLATRFELRPDDVIFIAEQPITQWNRVFQQLVPTLFTATGAILAR
ncbi:MAG: sugar transporter [Alphaproteobacteria bacterium HGW-Alphaproteobacteria-2]|nr:MAG: sugar transporter [Alphaproteobacteria bacterium HGW-Alphaproteobacteria-2]